jgi:hypothetical protein
MLLPKVLYSLGAIYYPPLAPSSVAAIVGTGIITLTWTASQGLVNSYTVYRSTSSGGETSFVTGISGSPYIDNSVVPGTTYYYQVTATNVVGEGPKSLEVHGATADGGNHGTLTNSPTWQTSKPSVLSTWGNSLLIGNQASNQYVLTSGTLSDTVPFSVTAWINRTATGLAHSAGILGGNGNGMGFYIVSTDKLSVGKVGTNQVTSTGTITSTNTWVHVAVTYDGTNARFYINGTLDSMVSYSQTFSSVVFALGNIEGDPTTQALNGAISDVRFYSNTILSGTEIAAIAAGTTSGQTTTPTQWWKCNEGTGVTAYDSGSS